MAKLVSESVVVTFSRILRDDQALHEQEQLVTKELLDTLEAVAQEMCGNKAVVEATNG